MTERPASRLGSVSYEIAMKWAPLRSGFHQGNFQSHWEVTFGDFFVIDR